MRIIINSIYCRLIVSLEQVSGTKTTLLPPRTYSRTLSNWVRQIFVTLSRTCKCRGEFIWSLDSGLFCKGVSNNLHQHESAVYFPVLLSHRLSALDWPRYFSSCAVTTSAASESSTQILLKSLIFIFGRWICVALPNVSRVPLSVRFPWLRVGLACWTLCSAVELSPCITIIVYLL